MCMQFSDYLFSFELLIKSTLIFALKITFKMYKNYTLVDLVLQ